MSFLTSRSLSILVLLSACWVGCGEVSEELWVADNGSGRLEVQTDASSMLAMMMMVAELDGSANADSKKQAGDFSLSDDPESLMKYLLTLDRLDTLVALTSLLPEEVKQQMNRDSLRAQGLREQGEVPTESRIDSTLRTYERFSKMSVLLNMDKQQKELKLSYVLPFESTADLTGVEETLALGEGGPMPNTSSPGLTSYRFGANAVTVFRDGKQLRKELEQQAESEGFDLNNEDDFEAALEQMKLSDNVITVHVPGEVTQVEGGPYESVNPNTVRITISAESALRKEAVLAVTVSYKPTPAYRKAIQADLEELAAQDEQLRS